MENVAKKQEDSSLCLRASVVKRPELPDYLPARMVNEFVYCPRLFYYEWVDGLFRESVDTVEGKFQHQRVDAKATELPKPEEVTAEKIHSRSVTLSSEKHRVIAKIDLVESGPGVQDSGSGTRGSGFRDEEPQSSKGANSALPLDQQSSIANLQSGEPRVPSPDRSEREGLEQPSTLDDDELTKSRRPKDEVCATDPQSSIDNRQSLVTPVDYKHGHPRETEDGIELWPSDRVQLAVQGLVLRENGYRCEEGVVYYATTRQRVRVPFDEALMAETERTIAQAWALARAGCRSPLEDSAVIGTGQIPPPLVDSPKCPGCSLVGICLPDETNSLRSAPGGEWQVGSGESGAVQLALFSDVAPSFSPARAGATRADAALKGAGTLPPPKPVSREIRQLVTPRDDLRPLYLNLQGLRVGKSGEVLQVREKNELKQEVRIGEICQVNLMGNVQVSTQAVQALCEADKPICYFSQGGWFYGITTGLNQKNIFLRRTQFRLADEDWFALSLARRLVTGKIRNQRTMLQRNHVEPREETLLGLKQMAERAERAENVEELLGIEGNAARLYFQDFGGMIKLEGDGSYERQFRFDFSGRNRRPPRDAVNALLSLAYSLLVKDFTIACYAVGFDPYIGFYHQPRFGRPALALDLMEPFRALIADSAVLTAINTRMVTPQDFVQGGPAVALTPGGRKSFFRAYELRMDTLVTHPLFEYRVSYRRLLEIQARLLARVLEGEIGEYPVFITR